MVQYTTVIKKFKDQGEKTGWTFIDVPADIAHQLKPENKKTFRVKGKLDAYRFSGIALMPMGGGHFIMPLNAQIRKAIGKKEGASLHIQLAVDTNEILPPPELLACLEDEPEAQRFFNSLAKSHQLYFTQWIQCAKTDATKTNRIAQSVNALAKKLGYGEMIRSLKKNKINEA